MAESRKFSALAALHHQQAEVAAPQAPPEDEPMPQVGEAGEGRGGEGQGAPAHRQAQQSRLEALFPLPQA